MASNGVEQRQHAIIVPFPSQGHVNPLLQLAKLLHSNYGFFITFVLTKSYPTRFIDSHGPGSLTGLARFRFESIPDGVDDTGTGTLPVRCRSIHATCYGSLRDLVDRLNREGSGPRVTCMVADGVMSFGMKVAGEVGIPFVAFWTMSCAGYMTYFHIPTLIDNGLLPIQDASNEKDEGYLDTPISCIPGMNNLRLKDVPSFLRTTTIHDFMLNFMSTEAQLTSKASAIILNTFEILEREALNALSSTKSLSHVYSIGPLDLLVDQIPDSDPVKSIGVNEWPEETTCMEWLDLQEPDSVLYVNFGSRVVMSVEQVTELAWGLANSRKPFLWVVRPDLVRGECDGGWSLLGSQEFVNEVKDRGLVVSWCCQKEVLRHESIAGFLTHSGWNSTLESISAGVPMICWPFSSEQPTNCRYCCVEWGIGVEIDKDMTRGSVEMVVKMLMDEEKGKEMKRRAKYWQKEAQQATNDKGSSKNKLDIMVNEVLIKIN